MININYYYRFVYTDKIELNENDVWQVIYAAKKYQLPNLIQSCIDYLGKKLNANNVLSILEHSRFFNEDRIVQKCWGVIEQNTRAVLTSDDFRQISHETLSFILESDRLSAKEVEIFESCYKWASSKSDDIKPVRDVLGEALFKIRFPLMTIQEFTDVVCSTDILTSEEQLHIIKYKESPEKNVKPGEFHFKKRNRKTIKMKIDLYKDFIAGCN